ncbi:MAG: hypothetical protein FJ335_13330, partial [Sphingomonadales bacterium]|nr:hypothetical protein [Sphingomonadales bacterium]
MLGPTDALQGFADAHGVVRSALEELRFPERVWPSEAARRHRELSNPGAYSGPWAESPHDMRFLNRAMDGLASFSPYAEVAIMGPAQTGKSEIGNNWQLHTILFDPADTMFVMPDKLSIRTYVTTQFTRMLDAQPLLRARQLGGPSSDNIELKQFRGCDFHFLHPSGPTFRARPIPRGRLDDYDDFDMDIGDQGDAWSLLDGRMASFDAFGGTRKYVNSTPKLGIKAGIEPLVAEGTDERAFVDCLMCGQPFLLDTEARLSFDRVGTPEDAEASAEVICPDCGGAHKQSDKRRLMATGRWVGRGQRAVPGGDPAELTDPTRISQRWDGRDERAPGGGVEGDLVPSKRLSQRLDGLMGMRT